MAPGAMLAVTLGEAEVQPWLSAGLALAAINGPDRCVLSGPVELIEVAEKELAASGLPSSRLATRRAFHSPAVEPLLAPLADAFRQVHLSPPELRYVSST